MKLLKESQVRIVPVKDILFQHRICQCISGTQTSLDIADFIAVAYHVSSDGAIHKYHRFFLLGRHASYQNYILGRDGMRARIICISYSVGINSRNLDVQMVSKSGLSFPSTLK